MNVTKFVSRFKSSGEGISKSQWIIDFQSSVSSCSSHAPDAALAKNSYDQSLTVNERRRYQIQALAPFSSDKTDSEYELKSSMSKTFNFGSSLTESGNCRRESATTEVIAGFRRHCERTSRPMKPVHPVKMNFISSDVLYCVRRVEFEESVANVSGLHVGLYPISPGKGSAKIMGSRKPATLVRFYHDKVTLEFEYGLDYSTFCNKSTIFQASIFLG